MKKDFSHLFLSWFISRDLSIRDMIIKSKWDHPIRKHWGNLVGSEQDAHVEQQNDMVLLLNQVVGDSEDG